MAPQTMAAKRLFVAALGASAASTASADAWRRTEWQVGQLERLEIAAKAVSDGATADLLAYLGSQPVQQELAQCAPEAAKLSPADLLARIRAEVDVAEVVSGFSSALGSENGANSMTLGEGLDGPPFFESNWQVGTRHNFNYSNVSLAGGWYGTQDDVETKLYGFRPFSHRGVPANMEEASERPPYCMMNLAKVDAGSPLYGDVSVVFANDVVRSSSVMSAVDTGGWTGMCNTTDHSWLPPGYHPNCSAYVKFTALGSMQHYDHLFLMNHYYWNSTTLNTVLCRLLGPSWGSTPLKGRDLIHYWENLPAAELTYPSAVKFVIGSFPELFGSHGGERLQEWCAKNGWVLVWSLGLNIGQPPANFFTAVNLPHTFDSNQRLVDPLVLPKSRAAANTSAVSLEATHAFLSVWQEANVTRRIAKKANYTVSNETWALAWSQLESLLPQRLHVEPLRAGACADIDACVGTSGDGDCLCYDKAPAKVATTVVV